MDMNKKEMKQRKDYIETIKSKLSGLGNDFAFGDTESPTIAMSNGNCYYVHGMCVRDEKLHLDLCDTDDSEPISADEGKGDFDLILTVSLNRISEALPDENSWEYIVNEIKMKLKCQPSLPYTFDLVVPVMLSDDNHFDCLGVDIDDEDQLYIKLYRYYMEDDFEVPACELAMEGLLAISENIRPPREIVVTVHADKNNHAFVIHKHEVMANFTEENLLEYLQEKFPTFEWEHDDENQYVYYPDEEDLDNYILANCYED